MSTALVVSASTEFYSKPIVAAVKASLGDDVQIVTVGDELDFPYGASTAASSRAAVVVVIGALIGTDVPALPAVVQALYTVGLNARVPVLSAIGSYANDTVARRVDARAVADTIVKRVNALTGGSASLAPAPAPRATAGAPSFKPAAAVPPPPAPGKFVGSAPSSPSRLPPAGAVSGAGAAGTASTSTLKRFGSSSVGAAPASPATGTRHGPLRNTSDAKALHVDAALTHLRENLKAHGASGIFGLARKFKIMDDDGSKTVSYSEFTKAIAELEVGLDDATIHNLFMYFDSDGDGSISYDEFLVGVRGELNDRRKALVDLAFGVLDKDGSGTIDLSDIMSAYDASKHPEVISGRKSKTEVFRTFLDQFDGGEQDGVVTMEEFERYYATLSASIDDDDYFELVIRNAWHISGGEGATQNTTCRRVLLTRRDGSQAVVEIRNDIGVGNDINAIKAALRKQGEDFVSVALYGSDDSSVTPAKPGSAPPAGRFTASRAAMQSTFKLG